MSLVSHNVSSFSCVTQCIILLCQSLRCQSLRCQSLRCQSLRCQSLRCQSLRCQSLRCQSLRCLPKAPYAGCVTSLCHACAFCAHVCPVVCAGMFVFAWEHESRSRPSVEGASVKTAIPFTCFHLHLSLLVCCTAGVVCLCCIYGGWRCGSGCRACCESSEIREVAAARCASSCWWE